jgi:hypothetical protein
VPNKLDAQHTANIRKVLEALAEEPDGYRAVLACQDAGVALLIGTRLGLPVPTIIRNVEELLREDG